MLTRTAAAILVMVILVAALAGSQAGRGPATAIAAKPASKVAVLVLENRSFGQVIGSRSAPYLTSLAHRYALETRYYATGHPSLPNYMALTTGGLGEVHGNCSSCSSDRQSLVNQLDSAGVPWRAYFESLPRNASAAVTKNGRYNKHYNPFAYTESVSGNHGDRSRVSGFARLRSDLARRQLPAFTWIAPNVRHDGHNHSLRKADRFAARTVPKVLRALGPRGVLYVLWDEGIRSDTRGLNGSTGGGHVALIAAGAGARSHARVSVPANHYALLRTLEAHYGLPSLGQAGASSTPTLSGLLKRA